MREIKFRGVEWVPQDHTASKWRSWDSYQAYAPRGCALHMTYYWQWLFLPCSYVIRRKWNNIWKKLLEKLNHHVKGRKRTRFFQAGGRPSPHPTLSIISAQLLFLFKLSGEIVRPKRSNKREPKENNFKSLKHKLRSYKMNLPAGWYGQSNKTGPPSPLLSQTFPHPKPQNNNQSWATIRQGLVEI